MKSKLNHFRRSTLLVLLVLGLVLSACTLPASNPSEDSQVVPDDNKPIDQKPAENAATDTLLAKIAKEVHALVKANWPHMDKVWPGYDYKNHNLLLVDMNDEMEVREAWVMNAESLRKLEAKDYESIMLPQIDGYSDLKFEGKPSLAIGIDSENDVNLDVAELYKVGTHEIVHFYYQGKARISDNDSRAQAYPIDLSPRLYRQMLYHRLIDAFDNPEKEAELLGNAKYWLEKWKSEFPEEEMASKSTDIAESTARYSENFGNIIGSNPQGADLVKAIEPMIFRDALYTSADSEAYEIGFIAGLILDRQGIDWKKGFYDSHKRIEEILLEKVEAKADEQDESLVAKLKQEVESTNKRLEGQLAGIIKANQDSSVPHLKLNVSQSMSSFGATGAVIYNDEEVMTGYTVGYKVDDKRIEITQMSVLFTFDETDLYVQIPLTMDYQLVDGVLTVNTPELKVDGIKVEQIQEGGRTLLTATVTE